MCPFLITILAINQEKVYSSDYEERPHKAHTY